MENQNKQYSWDGTANIEMTGKEFEILHTFLSNFIQSPITPQSILMLAECSRITNTIFERHVNKGVITEDKPEPETHTEGEL